jgi:hypothetical protein
MINAADSFIESARAYCALVESERHEVATARRHLLKLMQYVAELVVDSVPESDVDDYPRRGDEDPLVDHKRFADFPFQYYRMVFSPLDMENDESVVGDICDDLADIYGDLWHGLQALDSGDKAYAIWYWRESYSSHWGHHAAWAHCAIDEHFRPSM